MLHQLERAVPDTQLRVWSLLERADGRGSSAGSEVNDGSLVAGVGTASQLGPRVVRTSGAVCGMPPPSAVATAEESSWRFRVGSRGSRAHCPAAPPAAMVVVARYACA